MVRRSPEFKVRNVRDLRVLFIDLVLLLDCSKTGSARCADSFGHFEPKMCGF